MNPAPTPRRSVASLILGALAMGSSFAVLGVLVLSDVAAAKAPEPVQIASVARGEALNLPATPTESEPRVAPKAKEKPAAKKRPRKQAKVDFGRFEGY